MYYFSVERSGNQIINNIMKEFWKGAYVNARNYGDSKARIDELKNINSREEFRLHDLTMFGMLMTRKDFEANHPHLSDSLHKDCKDVMMYLQGYFLQGLSNGKFYTNQFTARGKSDKNIKTMEKYMFDKLKKMSN